MMSNKIRVGIVGAASISAGRLITLLLRHTRAQIVFATSDTEPGKPVHSVHGELLGRIDLNLCRFEDAPMGDVDVVFSCKRPGDTFGYVDAVLAGGARLIDLSADYRLSNPSDFLEWYGKEHAKVDLLREAVYGLPEWYRDAIKNCRVLANPGCYTTTAILALAPLFEAGLNVKGSIIVDAISGVSGAGRAAKADTMFVSVDGNVRPYRVGNHQHTPEIEEQLGHAAARGNASEQVSRPKILFSPQVGPYHSGILAKCYVPMADDAGERWSAEAVEELLRSRYVGEPFVRVLEKGILPQVANVVGTNYCDIAVVSDRRTGQLILFSATDNLMKGASGQAVQNMNIMFGVDERDGLR